MNKKICFLSFFIPLVVSCRQPVANKIINSAAISTNPKKQTGILQQQPAIFYLAEKQKPIIIEVPKHAGGSYHDKTKDGFNNISLIPPMKLSAQPPKATYTSFGTEDGLAQTGIARGFKDSKGFIWFATQGAGVSFYDGKSFTSFSTANGLAANTIWAIDEDNAGNIWFATDGAGATRYDGQSFKTFNTKNGLPVNIIWNLFKDKHGMLWLATNGGGACRFDGNNFITLSSKDGLAGNKVRCITEDLHGNFWFGTNDSGVSRYDGKSFTTYTTKNGLPGNSIGSILADKEGCIWFGTEGNGLSCFDGKNFTNYNTSQGLAGNTVWSIRQDKDNTIWFGCKEGGVSCYSYDDKNNNASTLFNFSEPLGLLNKNVSDFIQDNSGMMWIGTNGNGVIRYDGKSTTAYNIMNRLDNNIVWSITEAHDGNLWFGTNGGGISRFDGKYFTTYTNHQGLTDNIVWCITEDKKNNLWIGTLNGGISCFNGESFTNYTTEQGLAGNNVRCITEDKKGNIWIGTMGNGVSCFDGKTFTNYTTAQGLAGDAVRSITEDGDNNIWFSSNGGGVCRYDGNCEAIMNTNKKNKKDVNKLFTTFNKEQGLAGNIVFCITKDKSGMLWFGTDGGGVSRFDGKTFLNFTMKEGLADNVVYDSQEDSSGNIWFGTNLGYSVLSFENKTPEKSNQRFTGAGFMHVKNNELKNTVMHWEIYNAKTGYPIKDLNTNAMCITKIGLPLDVKKEKNIVWGGCGDEKVIRFDPSAIIHNPIPPVVVLQKIKIKEENISWYDLQNNKSPEDSLTLSQQEFLTYGEKFSSQERIVFRNKYKHLKFDNISRFYQVPQNLVLPYHFNHVTLEYNAIETGKHFMISYQYKLKGQDEEWSPVTKKSEVAYSNLAEGNYSFLIKAKNPDGIWSEPISYSFTVLSPWYRTWWAFMLYGLTTCGIFYGIYFLRTKSLRRDKELLEKKVELRTAEVVEQKDLAEQQRHRAEQSEKFKELFLASMSHEIRTPIHAVTGMTRLLLEKDPRQEQLKYLESIRNASDSLLVIVNDILDLSKIEAGKIELEKIDFSVYEMVKHIEDLLHFKVAEKGLLFNIHIDEKIPLVLIGDPARLKQILINILDNAIKFTERGSVTLEVRNQKSEVRSSTSDFRPLTSDLIFTITDTGIGMTAEQQLKLFQNYVQAGTDTSRKYGGTGLGLSISKQLVELHGGTISLRSEPGKGSTFSFALSYPISKNQTLLRKEKIVSKEMLQKLKGIKILVSDDNEYNRIVAKETLQLKIENVIVDEAYDGLMVLDLINENNYDVVLMDIMMPKLSGLETTGVIRKKFESPKNKIPILALTASVIKMETNKCIEAGMNGFVPKPFKPYELLSSIYNVLYDDKKVSFEEIILPVSNPVKNGFMINLDYLNEFTEGDEVRIQRYLDLFLSKIPHYLEQLKESLLLKDYEKIIVTAHSMKPLLQITGISKGVELAETIEQNCIQNINMDQLTAFIDQLSLVCNLVILELKSN